MSSYRLLGEGFEMKCTPETLMSSLLEVYSYHYKRAYDANRTETKDPDQCYMNGKDYGAVEAIEAIMLQVFGGAAMYKIWQDTMDWAGRSAEPEQVMEGEE